MSFSHPTPGLNSPGNGDPVIQVAGLTKSYGKLLAIKGLEFAVRRGEIFGLIGPDGAGKTTTFHILGGVMVPSSGHVQILGLPPQVARPAIGYLTQQFSLYLDLSVEENLRYSAGLRQIPDGAFQARRSRYLALMGLETITDRLAGQLSGGMKQKLFLCCCLMAKPEILLLDEPTTGVDPVSRRDFWDVIAEIADEGVTIVIATPYLDEAERCHRIALMSHGEIYQMGTLAELRAGLGLERLAVRTTQLTQAEQVLQQVIAQAEPDQTGQLVDVQTFGDRLDVLVRSTHPGEIELRHLLHQHNISFSSITPTNTTLENVFVTQLRQQEGELPCLPFPGEPLSTSVYNPTSPAAATIAISAQNLTKTYGSFQAVNQLNVGIHYGEIYGLLGANGAGKTTTIKMLCGLIEPTSGTMSLAGQTTNLRRAALRQRIGYMSQKFTLYDDLTIQENLEFYCGVYQVPRKRRPERIAWVLENCGLVGRETMLTGKLPGGWKQRVAFGASVMHQPEILFLDEPTSGVDPLARRQFWRLINDVARRGTAILVTTHYLEETEQCHRMGFMVAGAMVAQGSPSELKAAQSGQLLELMVDHNQQAVRLLKAHLDPWRVSVFGDRLHVILDDADRGQADLQTLLQSAGLTIQALQPIPFSMEDTFISIVQRASQ